MDQLKLSNELVDAVIGTLAQNDERAKDPFIASQYLAAITGYLVGVQDTPSPEKNDILEHLGAFSRHVCDDIDQQRQQEAAAPSQEAFGIWKPGDN